MSRMLRSVARRCGALLRRAAGAEHQLEHHARIAHHRQRLIRRGPADRVGVDAGVAVGAAAGLIDRLDAELHRRNRRVLPELLHVELIHRRADAHVGAFGQLRAHVRVHHGARAEVIAADFRRPLDASAIRASVLLTIVRWLRNGSSGAQAALAEIEAAGRSRPDSRSSASCRTRCSRRRRAPARCRRGACGWPRAPAAVFAKTDARRNHRVEQRQRDRGAEPRAAPCDATCVFRSETSMPPCVRARHSVDLATFARIGRFRQCRLECRALADAENQRRQTIVVAPSASRTIVRIAGMS